MFTRCPKSCLLSPYLVQDRKLLQKRLPTCFWTCHRILRDLQVAYELTSFSVLKSYVDWPDKILAIATIMLTFGCHTQGCGTEGGGHVSWYAIRIFGSKKTPWKTYTQQEKGFKKPSMQITNCNPQQFMQLVFNVLAVNNNNYLNGWKCRPVTIGGERIRRSDTKNQSPVDAGLINMGQLRAAHVVVRG